MIIHKSIAVLLSLAGIMSAPVHAQQKGQSSQSTTTRTDGVQRSTETTTRPVYKSKDGTVSAGPQSTTVTSGGYQKGGQGQAIPDNTRGSNQTTTYGVGVTKTFP